MKNIDKVLVTVGVFLVVYTSVVLILFARTGLEPPVLTGCVFAACIGEGSICWQIWRQKERRQDREWLEKDMDRADKKSKEQEKKHE